MNNPVKFKSRKSKGQFYDRIMRSGRVIFDGGEGYKDRRDLVRRRERMIAAIQAGNFTTEDL